MREFTVLTHRRPEETTPALLQLAELAAQAGVSLRLDEGETRKHELAGVAGLALNAPLKQDVELCLALGGDGTILRALRLYRGTDVPVFSINFGQIGFLATVEPEELEQGMGRALAGDFELLALPAIVLEESLGDDAAQRVASPQSARAAINDIAIHRKVGERVADIAYEIEGQIVGSVRCDGLVISTPAGSTGYNLANGGPVMAWGVEGFVVSFIAPHSLTARALVVAPGDRLTIHNRSLEPLDIALDGRPGGEIAPNGKVDARFVRHIGTIAQLPDSSFYRRLREKFGRLAS